MGTMDASGDLRQETVSLLLTDIEGSTKLWERDPSAMHRALGKHDVLIEEIVGEHRGRILKARGEGDSLVSVFDKPSDALRCALEVQRAFLSEPWDEEMPIKIRIAIHTGEVRVREDDLYGLAINRCARLRDIAHGGQILLSGAAAELVRDSLPHDATLKDLGMHRLRDLARAEHVFQVVDPRLPDDFPAPRSLAVQSNNLPVQLTNFIGREDLIQKVRNQLASSRLVTLTGPGGTGKTRLALQVAAEMVDEYPGGVWFTDLGIVSEADLVPRATASVLGLREEPGRELAQTLVDRLKQQRTLLLFDNCEHLIEPAAGLSQQLLQSCPELVMLATSREPLGVPGEVTERVPSLSVPHPIDEVPPETLGRFESVRLFLDRAFARNPEFAMSPQNAPAVAEITRRLDGLPLAIELAAARVGLLTIEQIRKGLDDRFRLLLGGSRTAPARQQTLRAMVDWSHDLLAPSEKSLFWRLAAFHGGFTLEAAEAVCAADPEGLDVLDALSQLVSKSMVIPDERDGGLRYQMLDTIREYAQEKLLASGSAEDVRDRHLDWFLSFSEQAQEGFEGQDAPRWLQLAEDEHENLRAALNWSSARVRTEDLLRMASNLSRFWDVRGYWAEGREWLEAGLSAVTSPTKERARALSALGAIVDNQSEYEKARELYEQALEIRKAIGDTDGIARTLHNLGRVAAEQANYPQARAYMEESLAMRRAMGDKRGEATTLGNLGLIARMQGDFDTAVSMYEEALLSAREGANVQHISVLLNNLGTIYQIRGDNSRAREVHEESLAIKQELGDRHGIASSLNNLGWLAKDEGKPEEAARLYEESLAISRELGDKKRAAEALGNLAVLAKGQERYGEARERIRETLQLLDEIGDRSALAPTLEFIATIDALEGSYTRAARLYGFAETLREEIGVPLPPPETEEHGDNVALARRGLSDETFAAEWDLGGKLALEEAVRLASGA